MEDKNDIKTKECIAISVDIRNSSKLYLKYKNAINLISNFIEKCYISMKKLGIYDNFIYAGDGIIGIVYLNEDKKTFNKVFKNAKDIENIILKFYSQNPEFNAGIGIDFSDIKIIKIKNMEKSYNNILYVGKAVSIANKMSKVMPLKNQKHTTIKYIALSNLFFSRLNKENQEKCNQTLTKYIA